MATPARELTAAGHRVAVIGAGVAGVATARALQLRNIDFVVFERQRRVGGLWVDNYPNAAMQVSIL